MDESLWTRAMAHLRRSQRWQMAIKLALILGGGLMAGAAQFDLGLPTSTKTAIGVGGAASAFIGGALLLLIEKDYVDLMIEARDAVRQWREREEIILDNTSEIIALKESVVEEREQMITFNIVLKYWDKARLLKNADIDSRLEYFLFRAVPRLVTALKLGGDHTWTFSVFQKKRIGRKMFMVRGPSCWRERSVEGEDHRKWAIGKGWTGSAWKRGDAGDKDPYVIEEDAAAADARARYEVDGQDDPEDLIRFRSVTAIPFTVPGTEKTFGVVTVTSSRPYAFGVVPGSVGYRNFNAINDFVSLVASLAARDAAVH